MILPTLFHFLLRLLFRRSSLPPSKGSLAVYILAYVPTFFLTRYLENIGTVKRDASGTLISSGEDLAQGGITEWCFDIIYVTCEHYNNLLATHIYAHSERPSAGACQIGSGAFGNKMWYLWLVVSLLPICFNFPLTPVPDPCIWWLHVMDQVHITHGTGQVVKRNRSGSRCCRAERDP